MLDSISRHNSKTLHVFRIFDFDLEPAQNLRCLINPTVSLNTQCIYEKGDTRACCVYFCVS